MPYKNIEDQRANKREYYAKNRDKISANNRDWKRKNMTKVQQASVLYRRVNKARIKQTYQDNRDKIIARSKGYYYANREQVLAKGKRYYLDNRQKVRDRQFMKKYGITARDVRRMNEKQKGLCLICNEGHKLVVDHCHKSGRVRGLLCGSCNKGLGYFRDSLSILEGAIKYLSK